MRCIRCSLNLCCNVPHSRRERRAGQANPSLLSRALPIFSTSSFPVRGAVGKTCCCRFCSGDRRCLRIPAIDNNVADARRRFAEADTSTRKTRSTFGRRDRVAVCCTVLCGASSERLKYPSRANQFPVSIDRRSRHDVRGALIACCASVVTARCYTGSREF